MKSVVLVSVIAVCVLAASVATATGIAPIYLGNRALGGADLNTYTKGVAGGSGANNIGLLIKTFGKVTYVDTANQCFYVDDGSGRMDGTRRPDNSIVYGVRVSYGGLASGVPAINPPTQNTYAGVTGIISTVMVNSLVQPNVRPRRQEDIQSL